MRKEIDIKDARPGDWFEGSYRGHAFLGDVYDDGPGYLSVAGWAVRIDGAPINGTIGRFFREVPDLPTEPHSLVAWDGGSAMRLDTSSTPWLALTGVDARHWISCQDLLDQIGSSDWWIVDTSKPGETGE